MMKKSNKTKQFLVPLILITIILFLTILLEGKKIYSYFSYNDTYYATLSQERQELYDKMKIKYALITNRKTGTASFDTPTNESIDDGSLLSNMNGIDVSEKDEYVRTFDKVSYVIEVGVDLNLDSGIEYGTILKGGVIKVRATIPKGPNGEIYGVWQQDAWMTNPMSSENGTVLLVEYHINPENSLVGGNQQLTFSFETNGFAAELISDEIKPNFEVWMEGNKPDNEKSLAKSSIVTDNDLYITGKEMFEVQLKNGDLNYYTTESKVGNLININLSLNIKGPYKGKIYPKYQHFEGKILLEYFYNDLSTPENKWIKIEENNSSFNHLINDTELIAYNAPTEQNENALPDIFSNSGGSMYMIDDGPVSLYPSYDFASASISKNIISFEIDNYTISKINNSKYEYKYNPTSGTDILFSANFELFVPYLKELGDYDYQLKATVTEFNLIDETKTNQAIPDSSSSDDSTYVVMNKTSGIRINHELNFQSIYRSSIVNTEDIAMGVESIIESKIDSLYSNYLGGITRLLTWNPRYFSFNSISKETNDVVKYGLYKENLAEGLKTTAEINSTNLDDFIWYDTKAEALKNGAITALMIDNKNWTGYNEKANYDARFNTVINSENISDVTHFRQKIYLYSDAERTIVEGLFISDEEDSYIPTKYEGETKISSETPDKAGETVFIYGVITNSYIRPVDEYGTSLSKNNYDVDEVINIKITPQVDPNLYQNNIYLKDDIEVTLVLQEGLTFIENSANIKPYYVHKLENVTYVLWKFDDYIIGDVLEDISFSIELDPFFENNTTTRVTSYIFATNYSEKASISTHTYNGEKFTNYINSTNYFTIKISNLSGSSVRKKISRKYTDVGNTEETSDIMYNVSEDTLTNVKTIQRVPKNNDANGSKFYGNYTLKLTDVEDNQYIYYSTKELSELNIIEDKYGNLSPANIDFANDSNWKRIDIGENIPSNATFIGSHTDRLDTKSSKSYKFNFNIVSGELYDKFVFRTYMSSDNLTTVAVSAYKELIIGDRNIAGFAFIDENENNIYDAKDKIYSGCLVRLLDKDKNIIKETTTDSNGYYKFVNLLKNDYYVQTDIPTGYDIIAKNTGIRSQSNVFNSNGYSDLITDLNKELTVETLVSDNNNLGLAPQESNIIVNHYLKGTTTKLSESETYIVKWGHNYSTSPSSTISSNYELVSTPSNANGVVSSEKIIINYYYQLKKGTITVHHYIEGTTTKLVDDVVTTQDYTTTYNTKAASVDKNYELVSTPSNASGTVSGDVVVTYYYQLKKATLTVHHYIEGTTNSLVADEISTVTYTHKYETKQSTNVSNNYELASTKGTLSGTVSGNIEVTYYYKLKTSTLIVKHIEYGTNIELAPEERKELKYTDEYETNISTKVPGNYEYFSKTENYKGIISSDVVEVIYYYQKKDSQLSSKITLTAPDEITSKNEKIDYNIDYTSTISDYRGSGIIKIIVGLPYHIDEEKSDLNSGVYNSENNTITWTINQDDINASEEPANINITKEFSVIFSDLVSTDRTMNTSVSGNIKLENNERDVEDTALTYIKISSKIIVHHYIEGTTINIIEDIETSDLVGETYVSEPIEKVGYILKKEPEDKNHIYQDEILEIIYEYERVKFNIVTKVEDGKGTINGDETVFYGEDSTDGNIIIKPSEGYEVSRIIINGEEQVIDECKNGCVLNAFIEVLENKEVIVVFEKLPESNPPTSSIITIFTISGLLILTTTSIILIRNSKPKFKKI